MPAHNVRRVTSTLEHEPGGVGRGPQEAPSPDAVVTLHACIFVVRVSLREQATAGESDSATGAQDSNAALDNASH